MGAFSKYVETKKEMYCNHLDGVPQMQERLMQVFDLLELKLRDDPSLKAPWHHSSPASARSPRSAFEIAMKLTFVFTI